ncbi:MAG: glycosyltransferase [Bacteroidetes bacterium]|nr:MAG: glycosyltransferase [Bacteroidota bacterium]
MNTVALDTKVETKRVIDLDISVLSYQDVLNKILEFATIRKKAYICFANAHMVVEAKLNKNIAEAVNHSDITTSDGMSVVMALKQIYKINQNRSAGMDMIYDILKMSEQKNLSIFVFGSSRGTLNLFIKNAKKDYPNLKINGTLAPPFREFTDNENNIFVEEINHSRADLLLVGLGCPKQEKWMYENSEKINPVMLGLGGAITLYASQVKRAPLFMQRSGFEWLFRLIQEPRRLWKRYLVSNTLFIYYFIIQKFFSKNK